MKLRETDKFVFFWGNEDVFSNFYYCPFIHNGEVFKWSEQAVMYRKAKLFGANNMAERIMQAQSPKRCKELGRCREIRFDERVWEASREMIYYEVLVDKFSLPELKDQLLATGKKHLAEASPYDEIWGIGCGEYNEYAEQPNKWKGLNLLGEVLMKVREAL